MIAMNEKVRPDPRLESGNTGYNTTEDLSIRRHI